MKAAKIVKKGHTANTQKGMGDFYGNGIKAKVGTMRSSYTAPVNPVPAKKIKKPPATLA